jgi:hypothetical protein
MTPIARNEPTTLNPPSSAVRCVRPDNRNEVVIGGEPDVVLVGRRMLRKPYWTLRKQVPSCIPGPRVYFAFFAAAPPLRMGQSADSLRAVFK